MKERERERERESTAAKAGERSGDFGARSEIEVIGKVYEYYSQCY